MAIKSKSKNIAAIKKGSVEKNNKIREEKINALKKWKKEQFEKLEKDINKFIKNKKIIIATKQNKKWLSVSDIKSFKKEIINLPQPYKKDAYIIKNEEINQTIKPDEIMRLKAYEKLSMMFKKVYIASNFENKNNDLPVSYTIIVTI
ncbi:hypothetical protein C0580_01055 [Candidatus Parcubacteria bacterium]|mgnify:CR=1 FL=1|nr:MAG: hypothetical protein C0580_01055 [Candidatus Parcubacteria bacterium]